MPKNSRCKKIQENVLINTNGSTINDKIAKIQKDTQELINKTIDGQPVHVNVVKVSDKKIIIEVNLNEFENSDSELKTNDLDSTKSNTSDSDLNLNTSKDLDFPKENECKNKKNQKKNSSSAENLSQLNDHLLKGPRILKRTVSYSCDKPLRGILKYPNGWKKRTLSESSYNNSISLTDNEDLSDLSTSLNSYSCTDLDLINDKPTKKVTFNSKIFKSTFSKNSSIMNKKQRKEFRQEYTKQIECQKQETSDFNTLNKKKNRKKKNKKANLNLDKNENNLLDVKKKTNLEVKLIKSLKEVTCDQSNSSFSESEVDDLSILIYGSN